MEITFKYNGKIITTPNLEKKLKRMKISKEDIEIIDDIPKEEVIEEVEEVEEESDKEMVIVRSTRNKNVQHVCYVKKGTRPPFEELFKNHIWNPPYGVRDITYDYLKTLYYDLQC